LNLSVEPNPNVRFRIAHEGDSFLVVDKPSGVSTQPGKGTQRNALLNGLFDRYGARLQNLGEARDFGLLHRLDKDASGLVLVALSIDAYHALREQFEKRTLEKRYWAVVDARPVKPAGLIRRPILEVRGKEKTAKIHPTGLPAATAYRTVASSRTGSLLECRIGPGRLHQIRVHLASIKCPILGDSRYSPPVVAQRSRRLALHAFLLEFDDPDTGERRRVVSPFPKDLVDALRAVHLRAPTSPTESSERPEPTDTDSRTEDGQDAGNDDS
jgi:23S rRNA pseudouridine1911/1915/1917 synthase